MKAMTQFTKGPWIACHDGDCPCGLVWAADETTSVGRVYGPHDLGDGIEGPDTVPLRKQQKANYRLVAAAPSMHEALAAVDEAFDECADVQQQQALELVVAALAQVEATP